MHPQPIRGYRFADFTLDLARRRLSGNGQESLPLSGRAFEVLTYLLAHHDRMVTKHELLDNVWPRRVGWVRPSRVSKLRTAGSFCMKASPVDDSAGV